MATVQDKILKTLLSIEALLIEKRSIFVRRPYSKEIIQVKTVAKPAPSPKKISKPSTKLNVSESPVMIVIRSNPGRRAEEIFELLGMKPRQREGLKEVLARLRKDGIVKTKGKARGTTYTIVKK